MFALIVTAQKSPIVQVNFHSLFILRYYFVPDRATYNRLYRGYAVISSVQVLSNRGRCLRGSWPG